MQTSRILVVDDEATNARLLVRVLERAGYTDVHMSLDSSNVIELVRTLEPQLLVIDLHMDTTDGFAVLESLRDEARDDMLLPVLVVTADSAIESLHRALDLGADDYLLKPYSFKDVTLRVEGLLSMRAACQTSHTEAVCLRRQIGAYRQIVTQAELDLLGHVTGTLERGDANDGHCARVGELAAGIAAQMRLDADTVASIRAAAPLHDVGKVAVSDAILFKPGPLTPDEMEIVCRHTVIGGFLLSGTELPLLRLARDIALYHHERWDGSGYPRGLHQEEIPLSARIVAVADVFDALTSVRSYKRAWTVREALTEIMAKSGTQFDPRVVGALVATILRRESAVSTLETADEADDSVLSLVDRQRQREAQLQTAIAAGHEIQRSRRIRDVFWRASVA
jgi:putative two-component system response regulator